MQFRLPVSGKQPIRRSGSDHPSSWASPAPHPPLSDFPTSPSAVALLMDAPTLSPNTAAERGAWGSPPRRPLRTTWQEVASESPSNKSDPTKPSHAMVKLVDVDAESDSSAVIAAEEEENTEDAGRQRSLAMGAEKFFDAFHARFPEGSSPVGELRTLFTASGVPATEEGIRVTVGQMFPEVKECITFQQAQEAFLLIRQEWQRSQEHTGELNKVGWLTRWVSGLSDTESSNLLLIIVLVVCGLSAFLAGGVAIILFVSDTVETVATHLQGDLGIVQDTVEVFAHQIVYQEEEDRARTFITTLTSILQTVGYAANVEASRTRLAKAATSSAATLSGWLDFVPQQSFTALALLTAQLANASLVKYGLNHTISLVDEVNVGMPVNSELMLGRWKDMTAGTVEFLTQFRNGSECTNHTCVVDGAASILMQSALSGKTSAQLTLDYRQQPVFAGSTAIRGLGVEFDMDAGAVYGFRFFQVKAVVDSWTAASGRKYEFMFGYAPSTGVRQLMTTLEGCDAACPQAIAAGSPLWRALDGETGTMDFVNFRGVPSIAAFTKVGTWPVGIAVQMAISDIVTETAAAITQLLDELNSQYHFLTEEFELIAFDGPSGNRTFRHLSAYRFADQCPSGQCNLTTEYVLLAAENCSTGVVKTTDYRGKQVVAAYCCLANLSVVLSFKGDISDVEDEILETVIDAINHRSDNDANESSQFLVATPNSGLTAADVRSYADFTVRSKDKYPNACAKPNCTWNRQSALNALQDLQDVIDCLDYRDVAVKAAPSRSDAISSGIGLAVELDRAKALQSMFDLAIRIGCFAIGMVAGSTILLVILTKRSLGAMIRAKEEDHTVVEKEKDRFSKLVASMYPTYVVPRLLKGEKQLVCEVPGAAVFFSDIHEFTSASNTLGSTELLLLMGYVYGVMDEVAGRFGVYKVKTIGDAYLAVAGLPGSEAENPSLDLLRFASFVCQVFGDRFVHPSEGQVLALMNKAMAWNGHPTAKQLGRHQSISTRSVIPGERRGTEGAESASPSSPSAQQRRRQRGSGQAAAGHQWDNGETELTSSSLAVAVPSILQRRKQRTQITPGHRKNTSGAESVAPSVNAHRARGHSVATSVAAEASPVEDKVQCVMSYGLAAGKIVAGVLAGRCPMFDIWGITVNLASRMQSTGEPGRIQVSEQLYKKVIATPGGQSFSFEAPHTVFCKGFGNVNAYMVHTTTEGLPRDLQADLRLEPRYGPFRFSNFLATVRQPGGEAPGHPKPTPAPEGPVDSHAPVILIDL